MLQEVLVIVVLAMLMGAIKQECLLLRQAEPKTIRVYQSVGLIF